MQRLIMSITATLIIALPAMSFAASNFVDSFAPGTYRGHVVSVEPEINDTEATMEIERSGGDLVARVKYADGMEEWVWNARRLTQTEYDAENRLKGRYTAMARGAADGGSQRYDVACGEEGSCTREIDPRHSWVLETDGGTVTYRVDGVSIDKWGNPGAKARSRHILKFTRVDAGIAKRAE